MTMCVERVSIKEFLFDVYMKTILPTKCVLGAVSSEPKDGNFVMKKYFWPLILGVGKLRSCVCKEKFSWKYYTQARYTFLHFFYIKHGIFIF